MKSTTLKQMIQIASAYLEAGEVVCKALKTYINDPRMSEAVLVMDKAIKDAQESMIEKHGEELSAAFAKIEEVQNLKEEEEETTH
jgi:hypothetical protein